MKTSFRLPWMSRADRRAWRSARTVADLGRLMAHWLAGDLASRPGYQPRHGPDPETADLLPLLVAANRAGYLTTNSQPGSAGDGWDGARWEQRAAVSGLVDAADQQLLDRLTETAERMGVDFILHTTLDAPGSGSAVVTTRNGQPVTAFGGTLGIRDLELMWRGCDSQALAAVSGAVQVTLIDPDVGPSTRVWDAVDRATARDACTACGCTRQQVCGDGCSGLTDQAALRCMACMDPSVLTPWPDEYEDLESECTLCGAPHFHSGDYCTPACGDADSGDYGDPVETDGRDETAVP